MTLTVNIISRHTIKPSTPTPHHLKTVKLSLLDQYYSPLPHGYVILFYPAAAAGNTNNHNYDHKYNPADHLKRSLSQTLTYFYPLAGRINDNNQVIDCNDAGVNLFETQVKGTLLNQVLVDNPIREDLKQLLPTETVFGLDPKVLLCVQTNMFDCGGMALAVSISHKIFDVSSLAFFLTVWSEVSKGDKVTLVYPTFDTATIFPPKAAMPPLPVSSFSDGGGKEEYVTERFVFDPLSVAALKSKCSNIEHPSRVEAVYALIWRCAMNVKPKLASSTVYLAMDLRPRMTPPLSNALFGNFITYTKAETKNSDSELQCLVGELREAKRKVDAKYVREVDIDSLVAEIITSSTDEAQGGESQVYVASSWCKYPFYQVDFGWGKPSWVCPFLLSSPTNTSVLIDTKCGNGVEAWITLSPEDMVRFRSEPDLIAFTFINSITQQQSRHLIGKISPSKM